ncbi:hypothetical protein LTR37_019613 [Vermiconidia calcicola]|uniref:Uncharacterized protein n=1 Tax=Vermiconidia calcicola TaxID=1690605 RepID=A0ACC3MDI9_9PEZI|nr:hypothetical protein LTR37_019613 [Vermiconidia calcicola]
MEEDNLIEIADKANDRATARSRFFTMPIELRLQIYEHILNDKDRHEVRITPDDPRFDLDVSTSTVNYTRGKPSMSPSLASFEFLMNVRRIHIEVSVYDDRRDLESPIATLEKALVRFGQSSELKRLSFHVMLNSGSFIEPAKHMRTREMLHAQRRAATREGVKARKNVIEHELDYAMRVVKMLRDGSMA